MKRTINFNIWKNNEWIKGRGIISESLLCSRPGCRNKPHQAAKYNKKKYCSRTCSASHIHSLSKTKSRLRS